MVSILVVLRLLLKHSQHSEGRDFESPNAISGALGIGTFGFLLDRFLFF